MNRYSVVVARRAIRSIARLPRRDQQRVRAAMDLLAAEPRPSGCVALADEESVYRVRVGDYRILDYRILYYRILYYRILYEVVDAGLVIQVIRAGRRRDVYRSP